MFPFIRPAVSPERGLARRAMEPFGLLRDEVDLLLERLLGRGAFPEEWFHEAPAWEVTEAEREVIYRMPLPGFEVREIALSIVGDELTLRAEHRPPTETTEKREVRPFEHVELTVTLPAGLEPERMEAKFHNGILEVHIPRAANAVPRRIEVTT